MHHNPDNRESTSLEQQGANQQSALNDANSGSDVAIGSPLEDPHRIEEERLKAYAHLLDSAIRLPGGFRIGLDGIVGLIPGVGDLLGAGLSGYFIYAASRLDIPRHFIVRMMFNTAIETVLGAVPIIGDAFDFVFKANDRNAQLLHTALEEREAARHANDASR